MADDALAAANPNDALSAPDDPMMAAMGGLQKQSDQIEARRSAEMKPMVQNFGRSVADYQQAAKGRPAAPKIPEPPQNNIGMEQAGLWVSAAITMGAIAGVMTRRSTTNALAAFTGAMEGMKEGNQQKFEQNKQVWEMQNKQIQANHKAASDAYQAIMDDKKIGVDQQMAMIGLKAQEFKDEQASVLAAKRDMISLFALKDARDRAFVQGQQAYMGIQKEFEKVEETKRHNRAMEGAGNEQQNHRRAQAIAQYQLPPITNPRNPQDRATMGEVMELNPDYKATKYTGEQSYQRTAGSMGARIETATDELEQVVPLASEASRAFPRGKFVPINVIKQLIAKGTSNDQYNDFLLANNAVYKAYGRAMNPQGVPRVSEMMEAKAEGILSIQTSTEAYETQLKRLMMEVAASKRAVGQAREGVKPQGAAPAAPTAGGARETKSLNGKNYYKENGKWFEE